MRRLSRDDVGELRYVDYSYWNELTGGSHLVRDGVDRIRSGVLVFGIPNDRFLCLADEITARGANFGPLIVWGPSSSGPLDLIEGHLRATGLTLAGTAAPDRIPAILGLINAPK